MTILKQHSAIPSSPLDAAMKIFDFGMEAARQMLNFQADGTRHFLALQNLQQDWKGAEVAGQAQPWAGFYEQASNASLEAGLAYVKTACDLQVEATRLITQLSLYALNGTAA